MIRSRSIWPVFLSGVLLFSGGTGRGCYSGLVVIPTADTLGKGQVSIDLQHDGALAGPKTDAEVLNTQFGVSPRIEAGIDYDVTSPAQVRPLFNAKYLVSSPSRPARLALGFYGLGPRLPPAPYVALTYPHGGLRLHVGADHVAARIRGFTGFDYPLTRRWTVMGDYLVGREGGICWGLAYQQTLTRGWMLGVELPRHGGPPTVTTHLILSAAPS